MLDQVQTEAAIAKTPAPRVTAEQMTSRIKSVEMSRISETVTLCNITLDNGFSVRGESACVSPENYNEEIGESVAYRDAFGKLWQLFGFLLAETNFINANAPTAA